ncbi:hypothetical protein EHW64_18645 [Erwinia psidii]|uniref:hypothetical protein n=1 Tax=Erwinia psidii TaxID=69224 RepID=UPI00226B798A|nr:hypothetical protein [Erwinia psidii]MCX8963076.1 hypothetical protein [Erwinia psidii]
MKDNSLQQSQPCAERSSKVHRHHIPFFAGATPNTVAVKRFSAALKQHDWNRNPLIYALRCERDQRVSVRSERRETYYALAMAMIANCDYNPDSDYLFEVMCSVEELARQTGQLHTDAVTGRKTYDPVLHTLRDWKEAGTIVVLKGQDPDSRQQKAMRIWIKPEFFAGLGFRVEELRDIVIKFRRWMERKGLRETYKDRYSQHLQRLARSNVADIKDKHSLKNLLRKIRRHVLGEQEEKKLLVSELEERLARTEQAINNAPAKEERRYWRIYNSWKQQQPLATSMALEKAASQERPDLTGEALWQYLVERIPDTAP